QAAAVAGSSNAVAETGRCEIAMNAASASGTSGQKRPRDRGAAIETSTLPSANCAGRTCGPIASDGKRPCRSLTDSPSSGATPATYTSPATLAELPATVITAPPYEWPTSTTGTSIWSMIDAVKEASYGGPRGGFGGARRVCPSPGSRSYTGRQLDASPNAP